MRTIISRHRSPVGIGSVCCAAILLFIGGANAVFADPPARVGRIVLTEGDVSFYANRTDGWSKARLNFPVTSKNSIWTNGPARAEVGVGASAIRIDADSVLDFTQLEDERTHLYLQRGNLNVRMRSSQTSDNSSYPSQDSYIVETAEGTIQLQTAGRYRFDASPERNETRVSVLAGQARYEGRGSTLNIENGKSLIIRLANGTPSFVFGLANESTFDRWAEARDMRWDETHQRYAHDRRVSPRMTGYEDLDTYGSWTDDREYGRLWTPRAVVSGWAPYRYGSWAYVQPWGWTWVDDAPWGFAPFHYGRWVQRQARWYWWPGTYSYRPVYAPALVGWYNSGNVNISLSIGSGHVGWFPLAPREHYVPHYTHNHTYIRNINNITNNITVIKPPARFANHDHGGTVVRNGVMVSGEPVWPSATNHNGHPRMTKPTVDPHGQMNNQTTATVTPPPPPTITSRPASTGPSGRNRPMMLPDSPSVSSVQGEPSRGHTPPASSGTAIGSSRTLVTGEPVRPAPSPPAPNAAGQTSVGGEAPRQHPNYTRATMLPPSSSEQGPQVINPSPMPNTTATPTPTPTPNFRSNKPNPVVNQAGTPIPSSAATPPGQINTPQPNDSARDRQREHKPAALPIERADRRAEQRVDGPVRLKEDRNPQRSKSEGQPAAMPNNGNPQGAEKPQSAEKPQGAEKPSGPRNNQGDGNPRGHNADSNNRTAQQ